MNVKNDSSLKKLQAVNLTMIKLFISICKKYDLCYYALGGTLLGAVRHQGFIPWDDDVDIGMPRPDYEKFLKIAPQELSNGYRLRTIDLDDEYRTYFVKLEDTSVQLFREFYAKNDIVKKAIYAWIDIMPIDGAPEDVHLLEKHVQRLKKMRQMISYSLLDKCMGTARKRSSGQMLLMKVGLQSGAYRLFNTKKLFIKFERECCRYPYETSKLIGNTYGIYGKKEFVEREVFGAGTELIFEDIRIRVPENYDAYLKNVYGDYMKLPPEIERGGHKIEFADGREDGGN